MKLKREHLAAIIKTSFFRKAFLCGSLILLSNMLHAQAISITANDAMGAEVAAPGPPNTASFTVSRTPGLFPGIIVNYSVTGTATPTDDFTTLTGSTNLTTGSVTIPGPLVNTVGIVLSGIVDDDLVELPETVIVTLDNFTFDNITFTPILNQSATVTIASEDKGIFSVNTLDAEAIEETPLTVAGEARFRIELDKENATGTTVTLPYTFTPAPTNGAIASDYAVVGQALLTFPAGITARTLRIQPVDDTLVETDESLILTLGTPSNTTLFDIGTPNTGTATIEDNDCAAGTDAPMLDAEPTEFCDVTGVNLNTFYSGVVTPGIPLRWSLIPNPMTTTDLLSGTGVTAATAGTYYAVFWSNADACASPASDPLVITINNTPSSGTPINTIPDYCNNADPNFTPRSVDLDNLITGEAAGNWSADNGNPEVVTISAANVVNFDNIAAGTYDFTYTTTGAAGACSNASTTISLTVKNCDLCAGSTTPVLNSNQTVFCGPIPASVELDDFVNNTTNLRWASSAADPLNTIVSNAIEQNPGPGTYHGFYLDTGSACTTPPTVALTLATNPEPSISATSGDERCGPGTVTLTASATINATINWYDSENDTTLEGSGSSFAVNVNQTTTFWVEAILNGCPSEREPVVATVIPQPSAGIPQNGGNASACSDEDNGPTILDLDDLIVGEDAGNWVFTSGPNGENINIPSNNIIDFENRADGDYVFTYTTTGAQAPCANESSVITISINDCDVDSDLDGLFDGPEATLGTDPNNPDSDEDGIGDLEEVGDDFENPLDEDGDGIMDALDSNILDTDMDGVVDQLDPANTNPCIPNTLNGVCDSDEDDIPDSDEIANGSDPLDACDPDPDHPNCNPDPIDLEVLKEVDNLNAQIGDTVVFTITVRNTDPERKARSIIVGDLLESGFEYVSHEAPAEDYDPLSGEWQIPEILAGEEAVLRITVTILEGGTYVNTAELLDSFPMDDTLANNEATVTLPIVLPEGIDLVLEKTALSPNPLINDEVIFTIKVINASIDELPVTNIEVEDIISADSGFVFIDSNPSIGDYDSATGIWSIESLNKGQEVTLEIRVSVPTEGRFTNTAQIRRSSPADGNPENNEATAEVNVSLPSPADVGFLFNQFSPNGDGTNDILKINRVNQETNLEESIIYNIQIFNRYGNLVFEANNKTDSEVWDGTWKGKDAPDGTYFYTMSIDIGNGPEPKKGWIQLLR